MQGMVLFFLHPIRIAAGFLCALLKILAGIWTPSPFPEVLEMTLWVYTAEVSAQNAVYVF